MNLTRLSVGIAAMTTMTLGLWLRWFFTGRVRLVGDFADLRHAHSHLGYYGVLFPLVWASWSAAGERGLQDRTLAGYQLMVALAFIGFVSDGYGPLSIAASTGVAIVWLASLTNVGGALLKPNDLLGAVVPSILLSLACVPAIAYFLRRDPQLAHGFVATFLTMLLVGVAIPSALGGRGSRLPWPIWTACSALGALGLGVWPATLAHMGIACTGLLLLVAATRATRGAERAGWWGVGVGLVALGTHLLPNSRPVVIGAIHFTVLGPLLVALLRRGFAEVSESMAWMATIAAACLALPLVLQGSQFGASWNADAAAGGGTAIWLVWVAWTLGNMHKGQDRSQQ